MTALTSRMRAEMDSIRAACGTRESGREGFPLNRILWSLNDSPTIFFAVISLTILLYTINTHVSGSCLWITDTMASASLFDIIKSSENGSQASLRADIQVGKQRYALVLKIYFIRGSISKNGVPSLSATSGFCKLRLVTNAILSETHIIPG